MTSGIAPSAQSPCQTSQSSVGEPQGAGPILRPLKRPPYGLLVMEKGIIGMSKEKQGFEFHRG